MHIIKIKPPLPSLPLLSLLLWSILIFTFSSFPAETSTAQSNIFIEPLKTLLPTADNLTLTTIVRKSAHFLEYFIFGLLLFTNIKNYLYKPKGNPTNFKKPKNLENPETLKDLKPSHKTPSYRLLAPTILISLAFATLDELHQLLVAGRSCQFIDIIIDTTGAITGIILFIILDKYILPCYNRKHGRN